MLAAIGDESLALVANADVLACWEGDELLAVVESAEQSLDAVIMDEFAEEDDEGDWRSANETTRFADELEVAADEHEDVAEEEEDSLGLLLMPLPLLLLPLLVDDDEFNEVLVLVEAEPADDEGDDATLSFKLLALPAMLTVCPSRSRFAGSCQVCCWFGWCGGGCL